MRLKRRRQTFLGTSWLGVVLHLSFVTSRKIRLPLHSHHASPRHRRERTVSSSNESAVVDMETLRPIHELALFQAPGTHYVTLDVGCSDPPQRISLIVDTGSGVTAFPCSQCHGCADFHLGDLYEERKASCYRRSDCRQCDIGKCFASRRRQRHRHRETQESYCSITRRYNEGSSWVAVEGTDTVRLDNNVSMNLTFGCQSSIRGLFINQLADGIMGMNRYSGSFWRQAYDQELIDRRAFALCFQQFPRESNSTPAGILTLGGADASLDDTPMVYAEMRRNDDFYGVYVENIHLRMHGGGSVQPYRQSHYNIRYETVNMRSYSMNRSPFIVDSGTTITYLNQDLEYPFSDAWRAATGRHYSPYHEYAYDRDELNDYLPTILFQLSPWRHNDNDLSAPWIVNSLDHYNRGSILVAMPPTHYMRFMEEDNVWVSRILFTSDTKQTLGSNFLQGKSVLFDLDHERIGFAESSCSVDRVASKVSDLSFRHAKESFRESMVDKLHDVSFWLHRDMQCHTTCHLVTGVLVALIVTATSLVCFRLWKRMTPDAAEDVTRRVNGESQALLTSCERTNGYRRYT